MGLRKPLVENLHYVARPWDFKSATRSASSFLIRSIVMSRLYSITRFSLKYFTCRLNQPQKSRIRNRSLSSATYPSLRTSPLKLFNLFPAFPPCLLVILNSIQDIVLVQAGEEAVTAFPASFARGSVGGDAAAVGGFRGVGGRRKPAHVVCSIVYRNWSEEVGDR